MLPNVTRSFGYLRKASSLVHNECRPGREDSGHKKGHRAVQLNEVKLRLHEIMLGMITMVSTPNQDLVGNTPHRPLLHIINCLQYN